MTFEHAIHLPDDSCTAGFDTVEPEHGSDVISEHFVRIDDRLVFAHGNKIDALGEDDWKCGFGSSSGITGFFLAEGASLDAGNGLNDGGEADGFYVVEHDDLGGGDVVLLSN